MLRRPSSNYISSDIFCKETCVMTGMGEVPAMGGSWLMAAVVQDESGLRGKGTVDPEWLNTQFLPLGGFNKKVPLCCGPSD